jgi:hypothetical protein
VVQEPVIYSLDVATFQDTNGDGIGDLSGVTDGLDDLRGLGITCLRAPHPFPGQLRALTAGRSHLRVSRFTLRGASLVRRLCGVDNASGEPMRTLATAAAVVTLTLAAACGAGNETESPAQDAQGMAPTEITAPKASPSREGTAGPEGIASPGSDGGGQTLIGRVGDERDPEAFVITLMDESGQQVTSLPKGEYKIQVKDLSVIHNFHLIGPGGLDESTTVPGTTETSWQVSLEAGEYTYVCDPHSESMIAKFTVTA